MTPTHVYITKYALSGGIQRAECEPHQGDHGYISVAGHWSLFILGRDCFILESDALAAAELMRAKKIASLEKQIAKLRAKKFTVPA